ncbi:MAG: hypothetical protein GYA57_21105 [Myxococcales bacterium]|nr:hypothetical protein [Myxococcales bacterium]
MAKSKAPKRTRRAKVVELERKVALTAPSQKKVPVPPPYAPGSDYGLIRRGNLR